MTSVRTPLSSTTRARSRRRLPRTMAGTSLVLISSIVLFTALTGTAQAAATAVSLGTAKSFAVLAGSGISNTGPTTITGSIGTFPTTTITGGAQIVLHGTNHAGDAVTQGAKNDLVTAYGTAAGEGPPHAVTANLGGRRLTAGVYRAATSMGLTGALTLDAAGDPDAVFVFQAGSTLTTASGSSVVLRNGARACNVFWQVGSSATVGTTTRFQGNLLARTSITLTTGAIVVGRLLARGGAVTLDTNVITVPSCTTPRAATVGATTPTSSGPTDSGPTDSGPTDSGPTAPTSGYGQVRHVPVGSVDTGDGSTAGILPPPADRLALLVLGGSRSLR